MNAIRNLHCLFFGLLFFLCSTQIAAQKMKLAWDPSPDTSVIGAKLYISSFPKYTNYIVTDVGMVTNYAVQNTTNRVTYTAYVTAYDIYGVESLPSNTIEYQMLSVPMDKPSTIILKSMTGINAWASYNLISGPTNGTLTGTPPTMTYTPMVGYHGFDTFTFTINENLSQIVTSYVGIGVVEDITYIGTKLEWWTNMISISNKNFNLTAFTNPPPFQFYRSYLIITNRPGDSSIVDLKTQLEWYTNMLNINRKLFDITSFTNPPVFQFYRSYLIITNKPF